MTTVIQRSPFTSALLTLLRTSGFTVGDGLLPHGVNWLGPVNAPGGVFRPYAVLSEITASTNSGPLGDSQADWQLPYLLETFGVTREQCGALGDRLSQLVKAFRAETVTLPNGDAYRFQQVRFDSIGEPQRDDSLEPPLWHRQDGFTLWAGKD